MKKEYEEVNDCPVSEANEPAYGCERIFHFAEHPDTNILVGAYREEKNQLGWILGKDPVRNEFLYNVRVNSDLFSVREGSISKDEHPEYVLIYNHKDVSSNYHLFPCYSSTIKSEEDMTLMRYPEPKGDYLVYRLGEEIRSEAIDMKRLLTAIDKEGEVRVAHSPAFIKGAGLANYTDPTLPAPEMAKVTKRRVLRFIDLFAGIGGIRCGLEQAAKEIGLESVCVFSSEIKKHAVKVLRDNHPTETINGDITKVEASSIPDFDILCAGFPCQAFSSAGKRQGFADTRGTMFFEVERILREKRPQGFILENVEGLVNHDGGKTLAVITQRLKQLGYHYDYRILNSKDFGVPQERKRIYIVGSLKGTPDLNGFEERECRLKEILESGKPTSTSPFIKSLLRHYDIEELYGKSIKDKRGGDTNIHSWDIEMKGKVNSGQKRLLDTILTERRKKKWAEVIGIDWMDGMPLTYEQIKSFYDIPELREWLEELTTMGYLKYEYPKKLVKTTNSEGVVSYHREYDETKPKGYNIVTGKLSFEINKILSPEDIAPTLVAMDMQKLYVADNGGLRRLTLKEGLRLCGYPEEMIFDVTEKEGFDLLGNTVVVPVIKAVASRLLPLIDIK